jgi:myosin-18
MLELRLYNTKKSIEQELEKDDIDGLSSLANSLDTTLNEASSIATTITTASAAAVGGAGPSSTSSTAAANYQMELLRKEIDSLKSQLKEEKKNFDVLTGNERTFFEAKLKEKDAELLEMEKQASMNKRKCQKVSEEMQDLQRMCDEFKVRNRELEKQQAKFDAEMNGLRTKYEAERELREKCERERDSSKYEIFTLKSDLDTQKLETNYNIEKCERLERDLKEYEMSLVANSSSSSAAGVSGGVDTNFIKSKSIIRELEAKVRDQEEELDEQALIIQQLEQAKLRLEMQLEKDKQKWQREIAEKESEMDDLRFHTQKKIKSIEMQLEEESEVSSSLQREKRDLERKMREMMSHGGNGGSGTGVGNHASGGLKGSHFNAELAHLNNVDLHQYVTKLKRQMLKYKTLAIDAQTQLEKLRENIPKQSILKALKTQLEGWLPLFGL